MSAVKKDQVIHEQVFHLLLQLIFALGLPSGLIWPCAGPFQLLENLKIFLQLSAHYILICFLFQKYNQYAKIFFFQLNSSYFRGGVCGGAWIFLSFPPMTQLPSSRTSPVLHSFTLVASRVRLRSGLEAAPAEPWETQLAAGVCYSLPLTFPSDEVGLKSNMKC